MKNENSAAELTSNRLPWTITIVSLILCGFLGYTTWNVQKDNQKLELVQIIDKSEIRILKEDIAKAENRPTYDEGYKDALIRLGGPQKVGDYQKGWDDAMKVSGDYAAGYHAAIRQFEYIKTGSRWLVQEPKEKDRTGLCGTNPVDKK